MRRWLGGLAVGPVHPPGASESRAPPGGAREFLGRGGCREALTAALGGDGMARGAIARRRGSWVGAIDLLGPRVLGPGASCPPCALFVAELLK